MAVGDEIPFSLEPETTEYLRELSGEDLSSLVGLSEQDESGEEAEFYIYALLLLFFESKSLDHFEQLMLRVEAWVSGITTGHPDVARRQKILEQMRGFKVELVPKSKLPQPLWESK